LANLREKNEELQKLQEGGISNFLIIFRICFISLPNQTSDTVLFLRNKKSD
jgi:hypothetical protein